MALKSDQRRRKNALGEQAGEISTLPARLRDMREHGEEVRQSKDSAVAFLKRAGILTSGGKLTKPYRD